LDTKRFKDRLDAAIRRLDDLIKDSEGHLAVEIMYYGRFQYEEGSWVFQAVVNSARRVLEYREGKQTTSQAEDEKIERAVDQMLRLLMPAVGLHDEEPGLVELMHEAAQDAQVEHMKSPEKDVATVLRDRLIKHGSIRRVRVMTERVADDTAMWYLSHRMFLVFHDRPAFADPVLAGVRERIEIATAR
jgi:hypothetical protein